MKWIGCIPLYTMHMFYAYCHASQDSAVNLTVPPEPCQVMVTTWPVSGVTGSELVSHLARALVTGQAITQIIIAGL